MAVRARVVVAALWFAWLAASPAALAEPSQRLKPDWHPHGIRPSFAGALIPGSSRERQYVVTTYLAPVSRHGAGGALELLLGWSICDDLGRCVPGRELELSRTLAALTFRFTSGFRGRLHASDGAFEVQTVLLRMTAARVELLDAAASFPRVLATLHWQERATAPLGQLVEVAGQLRMARWGIVDSYWIAEPSRYERWGRQAQVLDEGPTVGASAQEAGGYLYDTALIEPGLAWRWLSDRQEALTACLRASKVTQFIVARVELTADGITGSAESPTSFPDQRARFEAAATRCLDSLMHARPYHLPSGEQPRTASLSVDLTPDIERPKTAPSLAEIEKHVGACLAHTRTENGPLRSARIEVLCPVRRKWRQSCPSMVEVGDASATRAALSPEYRVALEACIRGWVAPPQRGGGSPDEALRERGAYTFARSSKGEWELHWTPLPAIKRAVVAPPAADSGYRALPSVARRPAIIVERDRSGHRWGAVHFFLPILMLVGSLFLAVVFGGEVSRAEQALAPSVVCGVCLVTLGYQLSRELFEILMAQVWLPAFCIGLVLFRVGPRRLRYGFAALCLVGCCWLVRSYSELVTNGSFASTSSYDQASGGLYESAWYSGFTRLQPASRVTTRVVPPATPHLVVEPNAEHVFWMSTGKLLAGRQHTTDAQAYPDGTLWLRNQSPIEVYDPAIDPRRYIVPKRSLKFVVEQVGAVSREQVAALARHYQGKLAWGSVLQCSRGMFRGDALATGVAPARQLPEDVPCTELEAVQHTFESLLGEAMDGSPNQLVMSPLVTILDQCASHRSHATFRLTLHRTRSGVRTDLAAFGAVGSADLPLTECIRQGFEREAIAKHFNSRFRKYEVSVDISSAVATLTLDVEQPLELFAKGQLVPATRQGDGQQVYELAEGEYTFEVRPYGAEIAVSLVGGREEHLMLWPELFTQPLELRIEAEASAKPAHLSYQTWLRPKGEQGYEATFTGGHTVLDTVAVPPAEARARVAAAFAFERAIRARLRKLDRRRPEGVVVSYRVGRQRGSTSFATHCLAYAADLHATFMLLSDLVREPPETDYLSAQDITSCGADYPEKRAEPVAIPRRRADADLEWEGDEDPSLLLRSRPPRR